MKQEFEWHGVNECLTEKAGKYLVINRTGGTQIKSFEHGKFKERYKNAIAWAEIPSPKHLTIMTDLQLDLMKVTEKIKELERIRSKIQGKLREERFAS